MFGSSADGDRGVLSDQVILSSSASSLFLTRCSLHTSAALQPLQLLLLRHSRSSAPPGGSSLPGNPDYASVVCLSASSRLFLFCPHPPLKQFHTRLLLPHNQKSIIIICSSSSSFVQLAANHRVKLEHSWIESGFHGNRAHKPFGRDPLDSVSLPAHL